MSRHTILALLVVLSVITFLDRLCISVAGPRMQAELGIPPEQWGIVLSSFVLAYGLFEIPTGMMGDRLGQRRVLTRVVLWWSAFTAITGSVQSFLPLVVTRFLFGAGEAGCFPNLTKVFMNWLPATERARAQAFMWLSARWAGAFTPLLVIWVMSWLSWRQTFVLFGSVGVVWAILFYRSFRDRPEDHPGVNAAELALLAGRAGGATGHPRVPWKKLLASRSVWLLWIQYFCLTYGWFFYVTWLPTYLKETRGVELSQNALMFWLENILMHRIIAV